jgi:cytoskeletal protein CcmA (bactofilin family)
MRKRDNKYENIESLISQGMEIKGQVFSSGSIRVDGKIEGELDVKGDIIMEKRVK